MIGLNSVIKLKQICGIARNLIGKEMNLNHEDINDLRTIITLATNMINKHE